MTGIGFGIGFGAEPSSMRKPHDPQKRNDGGTSLPHDGQRRIVGAAIGCCGCANPGENPGTPGGGPIGGAIGCGAIGVIGPIPPGMFAV